MSRTGWAIAMNLLAPGAGLVLMRREWLGLCLAVWFTAPAQVAVLGWWVLPDDIPPWMRGAAAALAAIGYLLAQVLLLRRIRWISDPRFAADLDSLFHRCGEAIESGDWITARNMLDVARRLDDEHPQINQFERLIRSRAVG